MVGGFIIVSGNRDTRFVDAKWGRMKIPVRTNDPSGAENGEIWIRSDL